jgi:hypothetical protein
MRKTPTSVVSLDSSSDHLKSFTDMRLLWFFLAGPAVSSITSRTFLKRNKDYTGEWEYGDAAFLSDSGQLHLTRSSAGSTGYAWFPQRLPSEAWFGNFSFTFPTPGSSSLVGIWVTKDFGPRGPVFGGPVQFTGVALLCLFANQSLEFELRENDGRGRFVSYMFFPTFVHTSKTSTFSVSFNYSSPRLTVTLNIDNNVTTIFSDKPRVRVRRCWLGVTGRTVVPPGVIAVNSIRLDGPRAPPETGTVGREAHSQLESLTKSSNPDIGGVLRVFDDLIDHSQAIVDASGLSAAVVNTLQPLVTNWQRRSLAIVKEVREMQSKLRTELNGTVDAVAALRYEVERGVRDVQAEIHDLESDLYFGVLKSYHLTHSLRKAKKTPKKQYWIKRLITFSVAEVGLLVAFLIVQIAREQLRSNRREW